MSFHAVKQRKSDTDTIQHQPTTAHVRSMLHVLSVTLLGNGRDSAHTHVHNTTGTSARLQLTRLGHAFAKCPGW